MTRVRTPRALSRVALFSLHAALLVAACDREVQFRFHEPNARDSADAASADAGSARFDVGVPRFDASLADAASGRACVPGEKCTPESACRRGVTRCDDAGATCEPQGVPFIARNEMCALESACDGLGNCLPCGGEGQPCCGTSCQYGTLCDASGTCSKCNEDAACRPEAVCRTGQETCDDVIACVAKGDVARATPCGDDKACDGAGQCVGCGGAGEPCCAGGCEQGATCDASTNTCFACETGASCEPTNPCLTGFQACAEGKATCTANGDKARATSCGDDRACDGAGTCVSCGGDGQPCCGDECSAGFACNTTTGSCFACDEGGACTSANGCRTGAWSCGEAGAPACVESGDIARATSCASDKACDGAGQCTSCGAVGEPCCGMSCNGSSCDLVTGTCTACVEDEPCTSADGCETGLRHCEPETSTCELDAKKQRTVSCGFEKACDGNGACKPCGGVGEPCCGTVCDDGAACSASGTCGACPAGMVLVLGGALDMGAAGTDGAAAADERPVHRVSLPAFCADPEEVTVAAYQSCAACSAAASDAGCNAGASGRDQHPINCVSWDQARAFCDARGARLPTEAEWEYLARSSAGRLFVWGTDEPSCASTNFNQCVGATVAVGSEASDVSASLVHDLAGNVAEWVNDRYASDYYAAPEASGDQPGGPLIGATRVVRGGSWASVRDDVRATARADASPDVQSVEVGFRCVRSLP